MTGASSGLIGKTAILAWLREEDEVRLEELWTRADAVRCRHVGDQVHLRGLVEFSNHCIRQCGYCGLRAGHAALPRYRMTADEIMASVREIVSFNYGTVVLQSGEDDGVEIGWLADLIRRIKAETPLAVTLSLGERPDEDLVAWRQAGADRYLLRFETSDMSLYRRIHPDARGLVSDRLAILRRLREIGYEIGSGVMIGIPGQTYASLAGDLMLFREMDLDMIGVGPYIGHPATPLGGGAGAFARAPESEQVPATELMTYKVVALTRLVAPEANIPSTTALATLNRSEGRELGLQRGANIVMPNMTPSRYRALYEIYPAKVCIDEAAASCRFCMEGRILSIGRTLGTGPGGRASKVFNC